MGLLTGQTPFLLGTFIILFFLARPARAFGAGNIAGISKVEGENWRHGDIEDVLLRLTLARVAGGQKFNDLYVSRVYFGNWLRDYSQAIDIGTVKSISAEAIRLLLSVLGFMTFGYGSREFEVTADRLGCYRPEDHIDNPKGYGEGQDPRQYDRRLRGPIDERVELGIDPETGMKNYIANERVNIMTSALHLRRLFSKCIELGRAHGRTGSDDDKFEALRLLGTGLHCLEDFLAHSNYLELALIEMGERDVFPHVGRRTRMRLQGARDEVYPIVTGTFGGVDFLASITGEVSDKLTQNEIEELEGTFQECKHSDTSLLESLLDKIPDGIFGGSNKKEQVHNVQQNAQAAQVQQMSLNPREPEELTKQVGLAFEQLKPAIETHDEIIKGISQAIDKIPVLPKVLSQLEEQLSVWVFSLMAPFVVPILQQVKNELRTGSSEIVESSKRDQHIVFEDDQATDPTHTMLSKDHFTNILNEPAGKTAAKVVEWVVPQLMQAWDDDNIDVDRTINRIIHGVLHHPAQRGLGDDGARDGREIMFRSVEEWWQGLDRRQQDDLRRKLSREGIEEGQNNKPGVHDCGHGSGKPLKMHKQFGGGGNTLEDRIATKVSGAIMGGVTSGVSNLVEQGTGYRIPQLDQAAQSFNRPAQEESSGGFGGILGAAGSLLSGGFSGEQTETHSNRRRNDDEGYTQETTTQYGRNEDEGRYGRAEHRRTEYDDGRTQREEYSRYEENQGGSSSYQESSTYESSGGGGGWGNNQSNEESSGGGGGGLFDSLVQSAQDAFGESRGDRQEERRDNGW